MSISSKIKEIIAETLHISPESVTDDLSIGGIPQWDSMGNIAVISAIEEKFDIEIPIEDLIDLNSVRSLVKEIEKING
ncbi:MAG: acyl carrier protein [Bacteroidales bacterium]|nr:acyl carrier protein [Bacteroidales bacterium]MBD5387618.1 acyl carrier protein [bacterium]